MTEDAKNGCKLTPDVDKARFLLETPDPRAGDRDQRDVLAFLTTLVDGDGTDPQITALLKSSEIWVVPQVNPDGIAVTENGHHQGRPRRGLAGLAAQERRREADAARAAARRRGPAASRAST